MIGDAGSQYYIINPRQSLLDSELCPVDSDKTFYSVGPFRDHLYRNGSNAD